MTHSYAPDTSHPPPSERILVMRYRFIGDTLLLVPFLRQLRAAKPHAQIDVLVSSGSGEVLQGCPYINHLIFFDPERDSYAFWRYALDLRQYKYDIAFLLKRSLSSAFLALLIGIPKRIGFDTEGRGFLLSQRVPYERDRHEIDCFLDTLKGADITPDYTDHQLDCWPSAEDRQVVFNTLMSSTTGVGSSGVPRHILLHLTSSNVAKAWPLDEALKLAQWLLEDDSNTHLHGIGAPADGTVYDQLQADLPEILRPRVHNHCGLFTLTQSLAFLKHMTMAISVDAGPLHMAAAARIPLIALFGPSNPTKWAPPEAVIVYPETPCKTCVSGKSRSKLKGCTCMQHLHAVSVIETIKAMNTFPAINRMSFPH